MLAVHEIGLTEAAGELVPVGVEQPEKKLTVQLRTFVLDAGFPPRYGRRRAEGPLRLLPHLIGRQVTPQPE